VSSEEHKVEIPTANNPTAIHPTNINPILSDQKSDYFHWQSVRKPLEAETRKKWLKK
jgi:hypothetical protein